MVGLSLLAAQVIQLVVHFSPFHGLYRIALEPGTTPIVSFGVSSSSVFTIRMHPSTIHGCKRTNTSEPHSDNESVNYETAKASVKRLLLTSAASFVPTCLGLKQALPTLALRQPRCSLMA